MDNNYDNTPEHENEVTPVQDADNQPADGHTDVPVPEQGSADTKEADTQEADTQEAMAQTTTTQQTDAQETSAQESNTQNPYTYTDPNADYVQYQSGQQNQQSQYDPYGSGNSQQNPYGSSNDYQNQYGNAYNNSNNQEFNYQDNYNYNTGSNTGYNKPYNTGMDESPMSLGDWVLTILIMTLVPCVGIVLYFVWAFSKNGNINRRNYCRAYLIITGIAFVLILIFMIIFGIAGLGLSSHYYY